MNANGNGNGAGVVSKETKIAGAVTFWTLTESNDHEVLYRGLTGLGLEEYAPEERTELSALKDALTKVCGGPSTIVERLGEGYEVSDKTERTASDGTPTLETSRRVYVSPIRGGNGVGAGLEFHPSYAADGPAIHASYTASRNNVPSHAVGRALVKILDAAGATPLRDTGGLYWIPEAKLPLFEQVGAVIRSASLAGGAVVNGAFGGRATVYLIRTAMDEDCVEAVADSLEREVRAEVIRINAEIAAGNLGKRALDGRQTESNKLAAKIAHYEEILGRSLDVLKEEGPKAIAASVVDALGKLPAAGEGAATGADAIM
jgi:hypothetical protein